jgi:biopolymer transport protein TolQ
MTPTHFVEAFLAQAPSGATAAVASANVTTDFGFLSAVLNAGPGEKAVMLILFGFSVVSWGVMAAKWQTVRRATRDSEVFLDAFWSSKRLDAIYQRSEALKGSPISQVFRAGYIELAKLRKKSEGAQATDEAQSLGDMESIERSMRRAVATELTQLESMIPFLATAGSTSPFIGLFGTVIGIVNAFREIGMVGNANLATVAPGIGGALVATAFGLFAAIPAVIGYNYYLTRIRVLDIEMQNFAADFLNIIKRHFF